ncbi:MAG: hypothetical protein ACREPG_00210 [Candidatus Binatia bacterium]
MATKQKEVESLRKITIRDVLGTSVDKDESLLKKLMGAQTLTVPLLRIIGIAKASKVKVTDVGESIAFIGEFEAECLYGDNKGSEYYAAKCFLPKFLEEELHGLLGSGTQNGVPFAFEIGVKYNRDSVTKYVYTAKPLMAAQTGGALALLKQQLSGKALPAPKG